MPVLAVILFIVCLTLLFFFTSAVATRRKLVQAERFGLKTFHINLPDSAGIPKYPALPALTKCSDAEAFFLLVTPYIGSLSLDRRLALQTEMERLKSELSVQKDIYAYFMDEFENYSGLTDEDAGRKWSRIQGHLNKSAS